jgi:luciferase family oxidoreductase group 1
VSEDAVNRFPQYVEDVVTMMSPAGVVMQVAGREQALRATPRAGSTPDLWLLGSSDFSARLAAARGLPYVFAHHFSGRGTAEALELYRSGYQPSERCPEPRTFLTVNAVVAPSQEEADRRALPNLLTMVALRTGAALGPQPLIEEAEGRGLPEEHRALADQMTQRWVIGTPEEAAKQVAELAATYAVDEVMVNPIAGAASGTPPHQAPNREETLRLLAESLRTAPGG